MMNRLRLKGEGGFTLIELLVVIAIIGILAAIAIPQFAAYRKRAYISAVKSDLRNAATSQEAYFVDQDNYSGALADLTARGYNQSVDVNMAPSQGINTFILVGSHSNCGADLWTFSSTTGAITDSVTVCQ